MNKKSIRLLYISPGPLPPNKDPKLDKFKPLSQILEGDILQPVWWDSKHKVEETYGEGTYPERKIGNFTYHFLLLEKYPSAIQFFVKIIFFIYQGRKLSKKHGPYDLIMSYGTNSSGLGALGIKFLCGGKLIAEIPGVPEDGSLYDSPKSSFITKAFHNIYNLLLTLVVRNSDETKLLYPTQLDSFPSLKKIPSSTFHDFVPTEAIERLPIENGNYFLFLGSPWYLKGVDILIEAFKKVSLSFPSLELRIVGWFPDKDVLMNMIGENSQICILDSVPQLQAYDLIAGCKAFILPSRSEAMGRVLLEAMAAKKPIIASNVKGIPSYLIHEHNGLLFESGNADDLEEKIRTLLSDNAQAKRMGENGFNFLKKELSEKAYVAKFSTMIEKIMQESNN